LFTFFPKPSKSIEKMEKKEVKIQKQKSENWSSTSKLDSFQVTKRFSSRKKGFFSFLEFL